MPRHCSKDTILDAAEAIVSQSGASHMTLDAVAERSGISKGGLIYNFPTKEALLEAMVVRMVSRFDELREKVRQELAQNHPNELVVEIQTLRGDTPESYQRLCAALLAVGANQPELTRNAAEVMRKRFMEEIAPAHNFTRSAILLFAAMGIHFHDLLHLSLLDAEQHKTIFDELTRLACTGEAL